MVFAESRGGSELLLSVLLVELKNAFVRLQCFAIILIFLHTSLTELFHGLHRRLSCGSSGQIAGTEDVHGA